jgi:tetratricopeptide (TPR) repeat protein
MRRLREASGWTLEELASEAKGRGVSLSLSTLHRIEVGRSPVSLEAASVLLRCLGSSLASVEELVAAARRIDREEEYEGSYESLVDRGLQRMKRGRYRDGLPLIDAAIDAELALGDEADPDRLAEGYVLASVCHRKLRHFELSLDAASRALNVRGCSEENRVRAALVHVEVHAKTDQPFQAELFARFVEARLDEMPDRTQSYGRFVLGNFALDVGEPEAALEHYERAREAYQRLGNRTELARLDVLRAQCAFELGRVAEAHRVGNAAYHEARRLGHLEIAAHASRVLGRMDARVGQEEGAYARFEEAARLARRGSLTHDLFLAWFEIWELARNTEDADRELRARRVLRRMLRHVRRADLPEARRFLALTALSSRSEDSRQEASS